MYKAKNYIPREVENTYGRTISEHKYKYIIGTKNQQYYEDDIIVGLRDNSRDDSLIDLAIGLGVASAIESVFDSSPSYDYSSGDSSNSDSSSFDGFSGGDFGGGGSSGDF